MSRSRKKAKKQLKKQNRQETVTKPSLPHAKRKGGRYVYPAGAYRAVMSEAPPLKQLPAVITVIAEPAPLPSPPVQINEPEVIVEPAQSAAGFVPQPWMYALVLAGFALLAYNLLRPSAPMRVFVQGAVKETAESLAQGTELQLRSADPLPELSVSVDLQSLKEPLENYIEELDGDWAVYIRSLNTEETLVINDHPMPSASLIKLFTAGCYLEELEEGRLEESYRSERDLELMISWSDNDAWQDLETVIGSGNYIAGLDMVTEFANSHGFEDTGRLIGGDSVYSPDAENMTSISDTGEVLRQLIHKEYVSEAASERILELMKDQHIVTKIPAGLPEGIESANKTGELSGVENDAAIVWGQNTDYILVIMSNDNYIGTQPVADLSAYIYGLLNPGFTEENNDESISSD